MTEQIRKRRVVPPAEKALEAVLSIERQIASVDKRATAKKQELEAIEAEKAPLQARLAYALANPDLDELQREARTPQKAEAERG